jgi:hypothetical protein
MRIKNIRPLAFKPKSKLYNFDRFIIFLTNQKV